jgi:hypothetical protein
MDYDTLLHLQQISSKTSSKSCNWARWVHSHLLATCHTKRAILRSSRCRPPPARRPPPAERCRAMAAEIAGRNPKANGELLGDERTDLDPERLAFGRQFDGIETKRATHC